MAKLIDKFNKTFNSQIFIEGGEETLKEKGKETDITLEKSKGKTIKVTKENGIDWPSNIKIEVDKKCMVDVKNPQNCKIQPCCWPIIPDKQTNSFSFDLFEKDNEDKNVLVGDPGATVTVGDEGVGGWEKKRKRRRP